jgi:hypothetical protein
MSEMGKSETIRVTLRVPKDIYEVIKGSCTRIKIVQGKEVKKVMSLNDAFIDFLWRGIETTEDDDEKDTI